MKIFLADKNAKAADRFQSATLGSVLIISTLKYKFPTIPESSAA